MHLGALYGVERGRESEGERERCSAALGEATHVGYANVRQVSGQAAASIRRKFTALFPDTHPSFPCPAQVIEKDIVTLRTAGLSQRKAEYIHGLAEKVNSLVRAYMLY